MSPRAIAIDRRIRRALLDHARREQPLECCGLLLGRGRRVGWIAVMENRARSRARFRIDPKTHIDLRRALRAVSPPVEIVGVYHSHPAGPAWPSDTDVREACYPEWVYVVIGLGRRVPQIRAFRIAAGVVAPLDIEWMGNGKTSDRTAGRTRSSRTRARVSR